MRRDEAKHCFAPTQDESQARVGPRRTLQYDPELVSALEEIKRLKRELKTAQEEREILKKATAYFAKNGQ